MNTEFLKFLQQLEQTKQDFRNLDHKIESLYQEQYQEKVVNGYEKWRFQENGGLKFVKDQLKKLDYKCSVCRVAIHEDNANLDHMNPKSKYLGDSLNLNNLLVMCRSCNVCKSNRDFQEWYSKLPKHWQHNLYEAILKVHGMIKIVELKIKI